MDESSRPNIQALCFHPLPLPSELVEKPALSSHLLVLLTEQPWDTDNPPTLLLPCLPSPRSQPKGMAPEASPERSCSLHTCPLEDPAGAAVSAPTVSTLQAVDPTSPLTAGHFAFPRAPQDYQEGSSLLGLGDQASLCAHDSFKGSLAITLAKYSFANCNNYHLGKYYYSGL